MSASEVANPAAFAKRMQDAFEASNYAWHSFNLWSRRRSDLHKLMSGLALLIPDEEIVHAAITLTPAAEIDDSSYEAIVFTGRHLVRVQRAARQAFPSMTLIKRAGLRSIGVLSAPVTTMSMVEPWQQESGMLSLELEYPMFSIGLSANYDDNLAGLIPSLVADLDK